MDSIIDGYSVIEVVDSGDNEKKAESKGISIKTLSIQRLEAGGEKYKFALDDSTINFYKGKERKKEIC
ncbi:hypothetical protein [Clostridium sp. FP1]|nr:hypothetical protein [Clostridium sp. FP1]MBZ9636283.1 hypothetical protein [Clostridium sp. FP1]